MKGFFALMIGAALFIFAGCGSSGTSENDNTPADTETPTASQDESIPKEQEQPDSFTGETKDSAESEITDAADSDNEFVDIDVAETVDDAPVTETADSFKKKIAGKKYAHYDIVAYQADMGIAGIFKNLIISYGFTTLELEGETLKITDRFCHSEQISNQQFTPTVPDSLTQAIIPDSTVIEIKSNKDGQFYAWRPETPTLLGITYDDPYNTPLPKKIDKNDPRLVDADHDGKPGVTVFIDMMGKKEELYIARREIFAFEAYLKENGNLEGLVHDRSEQLIIDATNFLLKSQNADWKQYEDLSKSPIILVPVDQNYDCKKLMEERDKLFPPNPPIWN